MDETWKADDANFANYTGKGFRKRRKEFLEEAVETAKLMDISANTVRGSFKCFPGGTAIGADDLNLRVMSDLPDVALAQIGGFVQTSGCHLISSEAKSS